VRDFAVNTPLTARQIGYEHQMRLDLPRLYYERFPSPMFSGRGAPYRVIGMVARYVAEVGGAYDTALMRVCRYFRYSLIVHSGI
jgi:hypothetical protein